MGGQGFWFFFSFLQVVKIVILGVRIWVMKVKKTPQFKLLLLQLYYFKMKHLIHQDI